MLEGIDPELGLALMNGYRVLAEGAGEVGAASFVYQHIVKPVKAYLERDDVMRALYAVATRKSGETAVRLQVRMAGEKEPEYRVVFSTEATMPEYRPKQKCIVIPLYMYARPLPGIQEKSPGNSFAGTLEEFKERLRASWSFEGTNRDGEACLRDTLLHEGMHMYDDIYVKGMQGHRTSRQDRSRASREESAPTLKKRVDMQKEDLERDSLFNPTYRNIAFGRHDMDAINMTRYGVTPEDMAAYREALAIDEPRRTPGQQEIVDRMNRKIARYDHWKATHSHPESRAYLMEQLPGLLERKKDGKPLDPEKTVREMFNRAFLIPPEPKKPVIEDSMGHLQYAQELAQYNRAMAQRQKVIDNVLPDARESFLRRARKIVDAINAVDTPEWETLGAKIEDVREYLEKGRQKRK